MGTNNDVGTFSCDGFNFPVQCIVPAAQTQSCTSSHSLDEDEFVPIAYCAWHS